MAPVRASGTEGYAREADALLAQYESVRFADVHQRVLHLIPAKPGLVLDIGSGTGRDAAALAEMGHRVVAVEPTPELRSNAAILHPSPRIEWLDDSLPDLARLGIRNDRFDVIMMTAVWMHLDARQRRDGLPCVAALMKPGGVMILSLRHGPVPSGRRMFDVSSEEVIEHATALGLTLTLRLENEPGLCGRTDVNWSRLAFANAA